MKFMFGVLLGMAIVLALDKTPEAKAALAIGLTAIILGGM